MEQTAAVIFGTTPRKVRVNSKPPHVLIRLFDLLFHVLFIYMVAPRLLDDLLNQPPTASWIYSTMDCLGIAFWLWGIFTILNGRRYYAPKENRKLCESGVFIEGRCTGQRRNLNHGIWYTFTHPATGESVERLAIVYNKQAADKLAVGDLVRVLYDPNNLKKSTVYETCGYEVVEKEP